MNDTIKIALAALAGLIVSGCYEESTYINYVEYTSHNGSSFARHSDNCFLVNDGGNPYGTEFVNMGALKGGYFKLTQVEDNGVTVYFYFGGPPEEGQHPDFQTDFNWDELQGGDPKSERFFTSEEREVEIFHYGSRGDCKDRDFMPGEDGGDSGTGESGETETEGEP